MTSYAPDCMSGKLIFNQVHYAMIPTRIIVSDIAVFVLKRDVKLQPANHPDKNYSNYDTSVQVKLNCRHSACTTWTFYRYESAMETEPPHYSCIYIRVNVMVLSRT